jgi:plasmid stabilization system protein ParE
MNEVIIAPLAQVDLQTIYDYIYTELKNDLAADSVIDAIYLKIDTLDGAEQFDLGIKVPDSGFRFVLSGNFAVFFRLNDKRVEVVRVLKSNMDYLRFLI